MKASEYIAKMQALIEEHGDMPVCGDGDLGAEEVGDQGPIVRTISAINDNCCTIRQGEKAMVIG